MISTITLLRISFAALFLACTIAFAYSFGFLQFYMGLLPCVLCILERFVVGGFLIGNFIGLVIAREEKLKWLIPVLIVNTLIILVGLYIAYRHLMLQYFPPDEIGCFVSLGVESKNWWTQFVESLASTEDCSVIDFIILGLSISAQVLIVFVSFFLALLVQWWFLVHALLKKD